MDPHLVSFCYYNKIPEITNSREKIYLAHREGYSRKPWYSWQGKTVDLTSQEEIQEKECPQWY